jgi:hypothetical protein
MLGCDLCLPDGLDGLGMTGPLLCFFGVDSVEKDGTLRQRFRGSCKGEYCKETGKYHREVG